MVPSYRVIVLPEPAGDIDRITDRIKQESTQNALEQFERLWKSSLSLAVLPHRYEIHRSNKDPNRIVRSMAVPPFIIYYRIRESDRIIEILTIRHGRQRQPRRFK